jgi:hypothetical protein
MRRAVVGCVLLCIVGCVSPHTAGRMAAVGYLSAKARLESKEAKLAFEATETAFELFDVALEMVETGQAPAIRIQAIMEAELEKRIKEPELRMLVIEVVQAFAYELCQHYDLTKLSKEEAFRVLTQFRDGAKAGYEAWKDKIIPPEDKPDG